MERRGTSPVSPPATDHIHVRDGTPDDNYEED
jgi:hypothetical protein